MQNESHYAERQEKPCLTCSILRPANTPPPTPAEFFRLQAILGLSIRARELALQQPFAEAISA